MYGYGHVGYGLVRYGLVRVRVHVLVTAWSLADVTVTAVTAVFDTYWPSGRHYSDWSSSSVMPDSLFTELVSIIIL